MSFLMLYILRISPLEGTYWKFGKWLCCWGLQTLTLFKTKISHFITLFCEKKDHFWWPFKSIFIFHSELSNKTTWKKKLKQENKIHLLDFLKVCWYRTCRQRTACSRPFVYKKYHVQDAWNCITCLRIKASKTLPFSLSQNRIRLRALVCFT